MKLIANQFAAESGHWYTQAGEPAYTITGKNGKERNTTLRDARKLGLVPSVTTILKVADKPALNIWKEDQILMSALTLPSIEGESLDDFKARVLVDSREQAREARELGTEIHTAIERAFLGKVYNARYVEHVIGVKDAIGKKFGDIQWSVEKSFSHPYGYGGKCDLHGDGIVLDFKTKDFDEDTRLATYDEHSMQLAAYAHGLNMPRADRGIVYVSTRVPGLVKILMIEEVCDRGWDMFSALLDYWQVSKGYFPCKSIPK